MVYTDGGKALADRGLVERGGAIWKELDPLKHIAVAYNLANAEMATWEIALGQTDLGHAWEREGGHLRAARNRFDRIGADTTAPTDIRLKSLTNAGNGYDVVGRDLDAIARWDEALLVEPTFGMALGNRGIALATSAPFMGAHQPTIRAQAARDLDRAISNEESVLLYGGNVALASFRAHRAKLEVVLPAVPELRATERWADPYLEWCRGLSLYLHVSLSCLREDTRILDPLMFRSLTVGLDEEERNRVRDLVDAFNAVKEDYLTARYVTWLATAKESPIREVAAAITDRATFLNSLTSARFGLRTGLAKQAFSSATNVLDKVAGIAHLYFGTDRPVKNIYFCTISRPPGKQKGGGRNPIDTDLSTLLAKPEQNLGLCALCDLSQDLDGESLLSRLVDRRHTATHRFLVTHTETPPESSDRIERVQWPVLVEGSVRQLGIARAALIYLVRAIDRHEAVVPPEEAGEVAPTSRHDCHRYPASRT